MEAKDTKDKLHTLILENRTKLTIDGINNVVGFDEDGIELNSTHGRIFIEGSELEIDELTHEDGKIRISGNVNGIYYKVKKDEANIFKRIFK